MKEDTLRTIINRKNEYLIIRFTNSLNGSKKEKKNRKNKLVELKLKALKLNLPESMLLFKDRYSFAFPFMIGFFLC